MFHENSLLQYSLVNKERLSGASVAVELTEKLVLQLSGTPYSRDFCRKWNKNNDSFLSFVIIIIINMGRKVKISVLEHWESGYKKHAIHFFICLPVILLALSSNGQCDVARRTLVFDWFSVFTARSYDALFTHYPPKPFL